MLYNVPEPKHDDKDENKQKDMDSFFDITRVCEVEFTPDDVESLIRLGKKPVSSAKPRPVLVRLVNEQKKKQFFKHLPKWRKHQEDEQHGVDDDKQLFINVAHDMSLEQREERKLLLQETKKKSEELPTESPTGLLCKARLGTSQSSGR